MIRTEQRKFVVKSNAQSREGTVAEIATVQTEGARTVERIIEYYNLDMIISAGYRVKSRRGVQFRIWAGGIIKEYMRKGFAMYDLRLKELWERRTLSEDYSACPVFVRYSAA